MNKPLELLKKYWGHNSFREPQEAAINAVMEHKDSLVLLPTGGGKSVCFQIPALLNSGICLVISPLVALMKDQAAQLTAKGIKTIALTGNISYTDLDALLDNAIYGNYKFLYLSPERLKQDLVMNRIRQMPVNLIAVDEAHCISQWGNDFRPAYKDIALLREPFPHIPIVALTATATKKVQEDIITELQLKNHATFIKSFARPNLSYQVLKAENKLAKTIELLNTHRGSSIIYVRNRKATIAIAEHLKQAGISSAFYHGGISSDDKQTKLEAWLQNKVRVMVATNAFGMGIDKPNVSTVFHLAMPENLENYYQEAGRAGRDEKPAFAFLLTAANDEAQLKKQFLNSLPDVAFVKLVYRRLNSYFQIPYGEGKNLVCRLRFIDFCTTYQLPVNKTYQAFKLLDRQGVIYLSESFHRKTKVQFVVSTDHLIAYLQRNQKLQTITKAILRTYGGVFDLETAINPEMIAKKTSCTENDVLQVLETLEKDGLINYKANHTDAEITFMVPREEEKTINPFAKDIKSQYNLKQQQVAQVIAYANTTRVCKSVFLLNYFGEKNATPCGKCSNCIQKNDKLTEEVATLVAQAILNCLTKEPKTSADLVKSSTFSEKNVLKVLQLLLEQGKIKLNKTNQYNLVK